MRIEHTIKVDFQRPGVRPVVRIVEGDASTRYIVANLYNGGEPFSVGSGVTGVVKYAKSDGHSGVYDTIDKDKATEHAAVVFHDNSKQAVIELAPNISMGFGLVALIVQFVATSGTDILGTFPVDVIVERDPTDGTEAEDYFSYKALDELYAAIDEAKADAAEALAAGLHDITDEYVAAKASRPTLTVDAFLLEQADGLYRINYGGYNPYTARIVTDAWGQTHMDVVEYDQSERIQRTYIDSTLITTVLMNAQDSAVTINPETLVGDLATAKSNISALQAENVALKNRVDAQGYELENLIVAGDGKIYTKSVDSSEAYTKSVPANALPYAALDSIGGKSVVLNQIIDFYTASIGEQTGVTVSMVDDVTLHIEGTNTYTGKNYLRISVDSTILVPGRVYAVFVDGFNNNVKLRIDGVSGVALFETAESIIYTAVAGSKGYYYYAAVPSGASVNTDIKANVIDLTKMFGAGNEPQTVEQAYAMGVPQTYIPYNAGEIVSADVQSINASGKAPNPIPQAIRTLPGYGWSADSVYNEVDYANKQYIQRVARVDIGSLPVLRFSKITGERFRFVVSIPGIALSGGTSAIGNLLCDKYTADTASNVYLHSSDKTVAAHYDRHEIWVYDTAYEDATTEEFRAAMSGVYLYYELAEPIITDISNLLPANFEVLPVEDSGTVTFQQANGTTLAVPATITFPIKIGGDA